MKTKTLTKKLNQVLTLVLTIAALMVGQSAGATTKTVTYTLDKIRQGSYDYLRLTHSGDTPFDGTTAVGDEIMSNRTSAYFTLPDGFTVSFEWKSGTFSVNGQDYWCDNENVRFSISRSGTSRYITNVKVTDNLGTPSTLNDGAPATTDYNYSEYVSTKYTLTLSAHFRKIVITYSDAPGLTVFQSGGTNTYNIGSIHDLRHLADYVNNGGNNCSGLTFRQTRDIVCDDTYTPIGDFGHYFSGSYDGQGKTVSDITVTRTGNDFQTDMFVGFFGKVKNSTVQNVVLASSSFTGYNYVGGIVGSNVGGTVQNCRVESSVTIKAGHDNAYYLGGIVGYNTDNNVSSGKIIGCISAATVSDNGKNNTREFGGIVGANYDGTVKDCLYAGTTVSGNNYRGAVVGHNAGSSTYTNNYYTAIDLGGVGADGSSSDRDGARQARTVTLGENIALVGDETIYNVSGLTAIGTTALSYYNGNTTTLYSGEGQTLTLTYTGEDYGHLVIYSATAGTLSGSALTMPAADITVSATFTVTASYVDAAGTSQTVETIPLDNTMTELSAGTYLVNSDITYTDVVTTTGDVTLILADGCTMKLDNAPHAKRGIDCGGDLTIYGQTEGTGKLEIFSAAGGINFQNRNDYIQHGGTVFIENISSKWCVYNGNNFTFDGGILDVCNNSPSYDITSSKINLLGGQLNAHGKGIQGSYITLGCAKATDRLYSTIISSGSYFMVVDGQILTDGTQVYFGMLPSAALYNITLRRTTVTGVTLTKTIPEYADVTFDDTAETPVSIPQNIQAYNISFNRTFTVGKPATLMLPFSMQISKISGADFYTYTGVTYNSTTHKWEATMTQVSSGSIVANTPYLVVPTAANITFGEHNVTLNTTTNSQQTTNGDWTFKGTYEKKTWTADDCGNDYGFAATSGTATDGVTAVEAGDFVMLAEGAWIRPMRSYLTYTGSGNPFAAPKHRADTELPSSISVILVSANGETTEISDALRLNDKGQMTNDNFYDLQGHKIEKPTKGLYIVNGRKVVVK